MATRSAERVMPPITAVASDAFTWSRASTSGRGNPPSPTSSDTAVLLLSEETSEAAPLIVHNAYKLAFCGGISGALAKTCTAPLARLTILYQVQALTVAGPAGVAGRQQLGVLAALRHVVATEGFRSLWKGNMVTVMHRIPYSATNFWTYESTKRALQGRIRSDVARAWTAGAVSGLVACTAAYPLDLLRTRIAAETSTSGQPQQYGRVRTAMARILAEQGVRGLYKGLCATLVQVVPGLAFNFCFYDTFKRFAQQAQMQQAQLKQLQHQQAQEVPQQGAQGQGQQQHQQRIPRPAPAAPVACSSSSCSSNGGDDGGGGCGKGAAAAELPSPSPLTSAGCACAAGLCTSTLTFPLDMVRRRLQVYERGVLGAMRYNDVVRALYKEAGVAGFYRGIGPEYMKVLPGMAIAFTTYETLKRFTGAGV